MYAYDNNDNKNFSLKILLENNFNIIDEIVKYCVSH